MTTTNGIVPNTTDLAQHLRHAPEPVTHLRDGYTGTLCRNPLEPGDTIVERRWDTETDVDCQDCKAQAQLERHEAGI